MPLFSGHIGRYEFTFTTAQPLAALIVVVVTAVNYFSVRMGGAIQVLLTSPEDGHDPADCCRRRYVRNNTHLELNRARR